MSESTETKVKVKIINAYGKNFKELEQLINDKLDELAKTCIYITNVQCVEHKAKMQDNFKIEFSATLYVTYVIEDVHT